MSLTFIANGLSPHYLWSEQILSADVKRAPKDTNAILHVTC
jgi:hypothetical protein